MSERKLKKMVFYRRVSVARKMRVRWIWQRQFGLWGEDKVRFVFAEDDMCPGRCVIIEAASGMSVISGLKRLDEVSFYRICAFISLNTEVRERARKFVRVSRLPEITKEEWDDEN